MFPDCISQLFSMNSYQHMWRTVDPEVLNCAVPMQTNCTRLAFWLHVHQTDLKSSWSIYFVVEWFTKQSRAWNLALTFTWLFSISWVSLMPDQSTLSTWSILFLWSGKIERFRCSNLVRCRDVYHLSPLLWLSILLGSDIGFHLWHVTL